VKLIGYERKKLKLDFIREAANILAGFAFGALFWLGASYLSGINVGLGIYAAGSNLATYGPAIVWALVFIGSWLGDLGGKILDARTNSTSSAAQPVAT